MRLNFVGCLLTLWLGLSVAMLLPGLAGADDYKVGKRLPKAKTSSAAAHGTYRKVSWDDLMPADWDPMKPVKGLDFSTLQDSDPRAIEALQKVKEFWDDAPIEPKMNGARIQIPGFVVPLDADFDNVKEFLLVPYFGACIHVPPPPSNQVIHIIVPERLGKAQSKELKKALETQGAIYVSGVIETVPSNTALAFASYRMKAEDVEPYRKPIPGE